MRATIYLKKKELENYLEKKGYTLVTLRRVILDEFGYKNSKHFLLDYPNLSKGVLNIKLAYRDEEEYRLITLWISDTLRYLKHEQNPSVGYGRVYGIDIKFLTRQNDGSLSHIGIGDLEGEKYKTLYYYCIEFVFRREIVSDIKEKIELNGFTMSV